MRRAAALLTALALTAASACAAEPIRIATYNVELTRRGPGVLLRDIEKGENPQIAAVIEVIAAVAPDVLALQGIDWDAEGRALDALAARLAGAGADYPHRYAPRSNRGMATGRDMDGDGRAGTSADAQGYGAFTGAGGMAVLSRFPIDRAGASDFSALLWSDLPGALLPRHPDGTPYPSAEALAVQRLSSSGHWAVPVLLPGGARLTVATFHAGPPVFDGPEDRNGRRNHDEARFWSLWLDGALGPAPETPLVIAGAATMDPEDSEGRPDALRALLADPRLQDPRPASEGGAAAPDQGHRGPNRLDTVDWPAPGPGRLRVDYVLPSADLQVTGSGVWWPAPGAEGAETARRASRHRLVWVDIIPPG